MHSSAHPSASERRDSKVPLSGTSRGCVLWLTGLSGAGKSTLATRLSELIEARSRHVEVLDGDLVRQHLSQGLGFTKEDRDMNVRRIGFVANLLARSSCCAIAAAISPYESVRQEIRAMIDPARADFIEVFVHAPLEVVEERDTKGLYRRARAGELKNFTGVSDPYEEPSKPEVVVHTRDETVEESADKVLRFLELRGLLRADADEPPTTIH